VKDENQAAVISSFSAQTSHQMAGWFAWDRLDKIKLSAQRSVRLGYTRPALKAHPSYQTTIHPILIDGESSA